MGAVDDVDHLMFDCVTTDTIRADPRFHSHFVSAAGRMSSLMAQDCKAVSLMIHLALVKVWISE